MRKKKNSTLLFFSSKSDIVTLSGLVNFVPVFPHMRIIVYPAKGILIIFLHFTCCFFCVYHPFWNFCLY